MEQNLSDPVIAEIREVRHRISARFDHDPAQLVGYYMELQMQYQDRMIGTAKARVSSGNRIVAGKQTFHTNSHGPDQDALQRGFAKTTALAQAFSGSAYVAVHGERNIQDCFEPLVGSAGVKELLKSKSVNLNDVEFYLLTECIAPVYDDPAPVFAPYDSLKYTLSLLQQEKYTALVYVPWTKRELDQFLEKIPDSVEI